MAKYCFVCLSPGSIVRLPSLSSLKIDIAMPLAFTREMGMEVTQPNCEWKL